MDELLAEVKNYLDRTWEDAESDKKLVGMIRRGISAINKVAGTEFVYITTETQEENLEAKNLLLQYVMYENSGALNEFWLNYKQNIISLQMSEVVKRYEESQI